MTIPQPPHSPSGILALLRTPTALAAAAAAGTLLLAFSVGAALVQQQFAFLSWAALIAAAAFLSHAAVHGRAAIAQSLLRDHRSGALYGALFTFSVIGITLLTNYIAYRHHRQWDFTRNHSWSLAPQTQNILRYLDSPVTITAYIPPIAGIRVATGAPVPNPDYDRVVALLQRFAAYSNNIHTAVVDPDTQRSVVPAGVNPPEVLFHPRSGPDHHLTVNFQEKDFAATLLQIERRKLHTRVYFLTGDGERPLTADATIQGTTRAYVPESLSTFHDLLQQQQYGVETLDLSRCAGVPPDCDLLVIAGAQQEPQPGAQKALSAYLRAGGKLLVLSDAPSAHAPSASLDSLLHPYGISLGKATVVGSGRVTGSPILNLGGQFNASHPVTHGFPASSRLVLLQARPVTLLTTAPSDARILASSDADTWGETNIDHEHDFDASDISGPIPIAAAVGGETHPASHPGLKSSESAAAASSPAGAEPRIVVIGCVSLASDRVIGPLMGTAGRPDIQLLSSALGWLTSSDELMGMPPPPPTASTRPATDEDIRVATWALAIGSPLLVLFIGAVVYWRRR